MTDFQKKLENWFIDMGYPTEHAKETDWKMMCCGRLPKYWKSLMNNTRSKQEIENILKNCALKEIKLYEQRKHSSAARIGMLVPPPQIHYPREEERLKKELDLLKLRLASKKNEHKSLMDERKKKCFELHKTKQDINNADLQIFAMKETVKSLKTKLDTYKQFTESANKYKDHFIEDFSECENFEISKDVIKEKKQLEHKFERLMESYIQMDSKDISKNDKTLGNNSLIIDEITDNMRTSQLCDLILNYQKNIPLIVDRYVADFMQLSKNESVDHKSLNNSLVEMKLFHCKMIIAIMQLKKECERARMASCTIKERNIESLSNDKYKLEAYMQECSRECAAAYKETFMQEICDLKENAGIFATLPNSLNTNKSINIDVMLTSIKSMKDKYMMFHSKLQNSIRDICFELEKIKQNDLTIKNEIIEKKKSRNDKVLWHPDYKQLQDKYLKIILKNPSLLKMESDNPFVCLAYLSTIILDYKMDTKLTESSESNLKQIQWYKNVLDDKMFIDSRLKEFYNMNCDEYCNNITDWSQIKYLQPLHCVFYALVKKLKLKNELDDLKIKHKYSEDDVDILGKYVDYKYLNDYEEKALSDISQFMKKTNDSSNIASIVNNINELCDFFIHFQKILKMNNTERTF